MSYEKELEYLRKEYKKSEDKFREAEREGYETDSDIWQNDMVNIGHQIHIHEQAAKADEYEAKARILDRVKAFATEPPFILANNEHEDYELYAYDQILRLIEKYESGEYDA